LLALSAAHSKAVGMSWSTGPLQSTCHHGGDDACEDAHDAWEEKATHQSHAARLLAGVSLALKGHLVR
jgi:hypothetical protein